MKRILIKFKFFLEEKRILLKNFLRVKFNWFKNLLHSRVRRIVVEAELLQDADEIEAAEIAPGLTNTLHLFLVLATILAIWAFFSQIDEVIAAKGRLMSSEPVVVLNAYDKSVIKSINVKVGQVVKEGELLATLDPTMSLVAYKADKARLDSLDAQIERLESEIEGRSINLKKSGHEGLQLLINEEKILAYKNKIDNININISKYKSSLENADKSIYNLSSKLESSKEMLKMNEHLLNEHFISRKVYLESYEKKLDVEKELINVKILKNDIEALYKSQVRELAIFTSEYKQKIAEELVAIKKDREILFSNLEKINYVNGFLELKAPFDSVVLEVANKSVGTVISEAAPLISLAPLGTKIYVHSYIQPSDVNRISVGSKAKIKIDAYPFQKYGFFTGTIKGITADAVRLDVRGIPQDKDYYIASIEIDLQDKNAKDITILPGMTLTSEILIGQRTIMSYLMYPILKIKDESLNEKR